MKFVLNLVFVSVLQCSLSYKIFKPPSEPNALIFCKGNDVFSHKSNQTFRLTRNIELDKCSVNFTKKFLEHHGDKNVIYSHQMSNISEDILELCSMNKLKNLKMEVEDHQKWPDFQSCQNIQTLGISSKVTKYGMYFDLDESLLSGLTSLEKLSLDSVPYRTMKIKNFKSLKILQLKHDICYNNSRILEDVSNLQEFEYYQANQNDCLVELSDPKVLRNLQKLSVRNTQLGSKLIDFANNFPNLKSLKLQDNQIESLDNFELRNFAQLEEIYLASNSLVPDCQFIQDLNKRKIKHDFQNCKLRQYFYEWLYIVVPLALIILGLVSWRLWKLMEKTHMRKSIQDSWIFALIGKGKESPKSLENCKFKYFPNIKVTQEIEPGSDIIEASEYSEIYNAHRISKISNV